MVEYEQNKLDSGFLVFESPNNFVQFIELYARWSQMQLNILFLTL